MKLLKNGFADGIKFHEKSLKGKQHCLLFKISSKRSEEYLVFIPTHMGRWGQFQLVGLNIF